MFRSGHNWVFISKHDVIFFTSLGRSRCRPKDKGHHESSWLFGLLFLIIQYLSPKQEKKGNPKIPFWCHQTFLLRVQTNLSDPMQFG